MLLRRVIEHVKAQNWTAVALDFVIVVVGVFIGIQVSNWNDARALRAEEEIYLERLRDDVVQSIEANEHEVTTMMQQAERASLVLEALDACVVNASDRDDFAYGLFTLGKFDSVQLVQTAFEELKSTGKVAIIRNIELRARLSDLAREADVQMAATQNVHNRMVAPISYIKRYVRYNVTAPRGSNAPIGWDKIEIDFEEICNDRDFKNAVSTIREDTFVWISWTEHLVGKMRQILAALDKEIEGETPRKGAN